ncbi:hypothetical protein [Methylobacterium sp. C25]|nr:hypothetical protein [Methylobacterium sp. C25]
MPRSSVTFALIIEAQKRQVDRGSLDGLTTVFVHRVGGGGSFGD